MSAAPTKQDEIRVEGGSYHTWDAAALRAWTNVSSFASTHSHKSSGFRTVLNTRQPKETPSQ